MREIERGRKTLREEGGRMSAREGVYIRQKTDTTIPSVSASADTCV